MIVMSVLHFTMMTRPAKSVRSPEDYLMKTYWLTNYGVYAITNVGIRSDSPDQVLTR